MPPCGPPPFTPMEMLDDLFSFVVGEEDMFTRCLGSAPKMQESLLELPRSPPQAIHPTARATAPPGSFKCRNPYVELPRPPPQTINPTACATAPPGSSKCRNPYVSSPQTINPTACATAPLVLPNAGIHTIAIKPPLRTPLRTPLKLLSHPLGHPLSSLIYPFLALHRFLFIHS